MNFSDCATARGECVGRDEEREAARCSIRQAMAGVQLRVATDLTAEEYVARRAWREASLATCPEHPRGGCGFKRHATYGRKNPCGTRVPRWYCPTAKVTFSLLPDCLASRYPAPLAEIEEVVVKAEQAETREKAVEALWPDIGLAGALRKLRRWTAAVTTSLTLARGLVAPAFLLDDVSVMAFREQMNTNSVLVTLRETLAPRLHALPPPLGFGPRTKARPARPTSEQHEAGPDPPT